MTCRYRNTGQILPEMVSIVLLHQKSSSSMFMVKNTLPSKHGMKGTRWTQNWIAKFKSKLLPIIGAQVRDLTEKFRQKDGMAGGYRNTWHIEPAMISIVLSHPKSPSSMFIVKNTLSSKHGMKRPRWMQNWIAKFKPKLLPTKGMQVRNFNG